MERISTHHYDTLIRSARFLRDRAKEAENCSECKRLKLELDTTNKKHAAETQELQQKLKTAEQECMFAEASLEQNRQDVADLVELRRELERVRNRANQAEQSSAMLKKRMREAMGM